jgi:integral membrane protein
MPQGILNWFRVVAFVEGVSYLVLVGIAMPLKYVWHWPDAVRATGMAHGVLFVAYSALVAGLFFGRRWTFLQSAWAMFLSFLPLGTFVLEAQLRAAAKAQQ